MIIGRGPERWTLPQPGRSAKSSLKLPIEPDQRNPHPTIFALPHQRAAKPSGDRFRRKIVMHAKVALVQRVALASQAEKRPRRIELGGEDQRRRVSSWIIGGPSNLRSRKIVDRIHIKRLLQIAEFRMGKLVCDRKAQWPPDNGL